MDKYTFIEFIAAQEGDDFNVIEGDNLAWARSWIKGMGDLPNWRHEGDCTKENYTCTLCVYELYLKEYREYYFNKIPISEWKTGVDEQGGYWVDPITNQKWRWEKTRAEQKTTR